MNELYEIAFSLILSAGNSKSNSMLAIKAAREFRFEEAEELLGKAQNDLTEAHQIQTNMIQDEARGEMHAINLIMVHAQDHLSMALMTLENGKEMMYLYKMIDEIKTKGRMYHE